MYDIILWGPLVITLQRVNSFSLVVTESYTTARDVLNVAHERLAPRVRRALEGVAGTSEGTGTEGTQAEKAEGNSSAQINPALRGISLKLLEKIKQKEASHMQSAITRDPAKEKKLEMLARLPDLCRILRSYPPPLSPPPPCIYN